MFFKSIILYLYFDKTNAMKIILHQKAYYKIIRINQKDKSVLNGIKIYFSCFEKHFFKI